MHFIKPTYRNSNRIDVNTGHAAFDRSADYIGTGNILSNIQTSSFIRPKTETECNGREYPVGALQASDLQPFIETGTPENVIKKVRELTETESVILYRFKSYHGQKRTDHGYAITRADTHELLATIVTGPTSKSRAVIDWCIQFVTPQHGNKAAA